MASTLSLGKPASKKEPDPVFDDNENTAEIHGPEGIKLIQGKWFFDKSHRYLGPAPEGMWMAPLTPEQRMNLRKQHEKNKKFFGSAKPNIREAGIPQKVIDAERENARAAAAESQAA
jgi:hypothetical protein